MARAESIGVEFKRFVDSREEWEAECLRIKQHRCPHCLIRGTLTRHGFLYGFPLQLDLPRTQRGFRLLCSNRHRSRGCGRTVTIYFSCILRRCVAGAQDLWKFIQGLLNNERCYTVARRLSMALSVATPYRWKARLELAQFTLRRVLHPYFCESAAHRPLPWAWLHPYDQLGHCMPDDAIRWFQHRFQTSLFPP